MNEKISCPACGRDQEPSDECVWCGVVFRKFKSKQTGRPESPSSSPEPPRNLNTGNGKKEAKPVSVHRAFVYSAVLPGWGEIHAGSRIRGAVTLVLFLFFTTWFTWTFISLASSAVDFFIDSIEGRGTAALPTLPLQAIIISIAGMYATWLWAMISSVDIAMQNRLSNNAPEQSNTVWGVLFSWLCPGAGQLYTGARIGYLLFLSHVIALFFLLPVFADLAEHLKTLFQDGQTSYSDPFAAALLAKELSLKLEFSFATSLLTMVRLTAIALTVHALRRRFQFKDRILNYIALFIAGWICPGSGQIHSDRGRAGWAILCAYIASLFTIWFLLHIGTISLQDAEIAAWAPTLIQWAAMIEAPVKHSSR